MILPDGTKSEEFGQELVLDLYQCDPKKISDGKHIRQFAIKLCDLIKMKRFGEPLVPHFGHRDPLTSGYSLVQLIETSSITAHFSDYKRSVYLNIFSCKWFDPVHAAEFAKEWFGAQRVRRKFLARR